MELKLIVSNDSYILDIKYLGNAIMDFRIN